GQEQRLMAIRYGNIAHPQGGVRYGSLIWQPLQGIFITSAPAMVDGEPYTFEVHDVNESITAVAVNGVEFSPFTRVGDEFSLDRTPAPTLLDWSAILCVLNSGGEVLASTIVQLNPSTDVAAWIVLHQYPPTSGIDGQTARSIGEGFNPAPEPGMQLSV